MTPGPVGAQRDEPCLEGVREPVLSWVFEKARYRTPTSAKKIEEGARPIFRRQRLRPVALLRADWHDPDFHGVLTSSTPQSQRPVAGGRDGHVKSSDNRIDLDTRRRRASGAARNQTRATVLGRPRLFLSALQPIAPRRRWPSTARPVSTPRWASAGLQTRIRDQRPPDRLPGPAEQGQAEDLML